MRVIPAAILIILAMLFTAASTTAQAPLQTTIHLQFPLASAPTDATMTYTLTNTETNNTVTNQVMFVQNLAIEVLPGYTLLAISIDDSRTPGVDYSGSASFYASSNLTDVSVQVLPIGAVAVSVVDTDHMPVPNAPVRIDCTKNYGQQGYFRTDTFGIVDADTLPVGECVIRAAVNNVIAHQSINVNRGSKNTIEVRLEGYHVQPINYWLIGVILLIIIFVGGYGYTQYRKSRPANKVRTNAGSKKSHNARVARIRKNIPEKEKSAETTPAVHAAQSVKDGIIRALGRKEQVVVRYMLGEFQEGKKHVSQAMIVYGAKIPKTSLARILESLEQKHIIEIERIGKLKKVTFTDWFKSR